MFNKSTHREKSNADFIYPTTHDAVLNILKSREIAKSAAAVAAISATSFTSNGSGVSSLSLQIEKDKYEKLEGDEKTGLTPKIYLKKKDDYDIINEIVSAI